VNSVCVVIDKGAPQHVTLRLMAALDALAATGKHCQQ